MDVDMEKLIDEVWNSSLARITKKAVSLVRPSLGDEVDMFVPQTRLLLLFKANPSLASLLYNSAYTSASRNAYVIMRKLGMPADYFWKFEYWPKDRALDTLRRVINRVFTAMMSLNKEGLLDIKDVDVEHMRFTLSFKECAECAGITTGNGICYYHAATFSGIVAALINKELDGYETECQAKGDATCTFVIGKRDDKEIAGRLTNYLSPTISELKLDDRLANCLKGNPLRSQGNLVNIGYYQLVLTNAIITNPMLFASSSFEAGVEYGARLASLLPTFYHESGTEALKKYYNQLRYLNIREVEIGPDIDIVAGECPEVAATVKKRELISFFLGELQGLISALTNQKVVYKESSLENSNLKVKLSPGV